MVDHFSFHLIHLCVNSTLFGSGSNRNKLIEELNNTTFYLYYKYSPSVLFWVKYTLILNAGRQRKINCLFPSPFYFWAFSVLIQKSLRYATPDSILSIIKC